ncbi:hypothetical protein JXA12_04160 [Candidatus Woesearchaeota archaeon]|nr:hypothetical protein [Candidatus Woesearchaeota archaeon]
MEKGLKRQLLITLSLTLTGLPLATAARTGIQPLNGVLELISSVFYPSAILNNTTLRIGFFKALYFFLIFAVVNIILKKAKVFQGDDNSKRGATVAAAVFALIAAFFMPAQASEGLAGFIVTIFTLIAPVGLAGFLAYYSMAKLKKDWIQHLFGLILLFVSSFIISWTMGAIPTMRVAQDLTDTILSYALLAINILIIIKLIQLISAAFKGVKLPSIRPGGGGDGGGGGGERPERPPKEPATIMVRVLSADNQPLPETIVEWVRRRRVKARDITNAQGNAPTSGQPFSLHPVKHTLRCTYRLGDHQEFVPTQNNTLEDGHTVILKQNFSLRRGDNGTITIILGVRQRGEGGEDGGDEDFCPRITNLRLIQPEVLRAEAVIDAQEAQLDVQGAEQDVRQATVEGPPAQGGERP